MFMIMWQLLVVSNSVLTWVHGTWEVVAADTTLIEAAQGGSRLLAVSTDLGKKVQMWQVNKKSIQNHYSSTDVAALNRVKWTIRKAFCTIYR